MRLKNIINREKKTLSRFFVWLVFALLFSITPINTKAHQETELFFNSTHWGISLAETYSTTINRMFLPWNYNSSGEAIYKEYTENFGPFTWIEQCVKIGFKANISQSIFLTEQAGFDESFIAGRDQRLFGTYDAFE